MSGARAISGRISRGLAGLMVATVIIQFYTAGLGIFGGASFTAHKILGSASALVALLLVVFVLVARRGREISLYAVGCLLLTFLQPVLVFVVRPRSPELAAVHPVVGLLIGVLAWLIASRTADRSQPLPQVSLQG
jgi:heme A synthase